MLVGLAWTNSPNTFHFQLLKWVWYFTSTIFMPQYPLNGPTTVKMSNKFDNIKYNIITQNKDDMKII